MSAGWVAVGVRARAMTRRRVGPAGVAALAACRCLEDALAVLGPTAYGHEVRVGQDLPTAQRAVTAGWLWNVRVLAGWGPRQAVVLLRPLVAGLEVANTLDHLDRLNGRDVPAPYVLGGLGTAWSRTARTTSADDLRAVLAGSVWGDPGATTTRAVGLAMRAALVEQVVHHVRAAAPWASGALAIGLAALLTEGAGAPAAALVPATRVLGRAAVQARTLTALRASLSPDAAWPLADIDEPSDLWRAETRWWTVVDQEAKALVHRATRGPDPVVGAVALLAVDAWQVRGALDRAALGEGGTGAVA